MPYNKLNEVKKLLKSLKKKEGLCFISECGKKAIGSHTISESRILEKLQEKDNNNGIVLIQLEDKPNIDFQNRKISTFKKTERKLVRNAKSNSSVFYGFCDDHDPKLFYELDNQLYANKPRINFLHSYRAFAIYITNSFQNFELLIDTLENNKNLTPKLAGLSDELIEMKKGINLIPDNFPIDFDTIEPLISKTEELIQSDIVISESKLRNSFGSISNILDKSNYPINGKIFKKHFSDFINSSIPKIQTPIEELINLEKAVLESQREYQQIKTLYNSICLNETYEDINYLSRTLNQSYKITGNFVFKSSENEFCSLTFFPELEINKTQVIITTLADNSTYLSRINILNDLEFNKFISSIIITQGANVFMSPSFYYSLDNKIQEKMVDSKSNTPNFDINIFEKNYG